MKRWLFFCLILVSLFFCLLARADDAEDAYQTARNAYRKLLVDFPAQHQRDNWESHIRRFLSFTADHPRHARAPDALFNAADAYVRMARWSGQLDDLQEAARVYDRLARTYPDSTLADDALCKAASILEYKLSAPAEAYLRYQLVLDEHENGDQTNCATEGIIRLANHAPADETPAQPLDSGNVVAERTENTFENHLEQMRIWSHPQRARVVITLAAQTTISQQSMQPNIGSPQNGSLRLLLHEVGRNNVDVPSFNPGLLQQANLETHDQGVVLDLQLRPFNSFRIVTLDNPHRIVIDVQKTPTVSQRSRPDENDIYTIVLDPGHGGDDLGTHNDTLLEKDIVLNIARLLKNRLALNKNLRVLLTRDDDTYLPLDVRAAMANDVNADLFISIHVNASHLETSNGVETYVFASESQPDDEAIVQFENQSSSESAALMQGNAPFGGRRIREESLRLANIVQKYLLERIRSERNRVANRGVKQAPMYVLMDTQMPAVLVEVGFSTHPVESHLLTTESYQRLLADGIANGILFYLAQQNPNGN